MLPTNFILNRVRVPYIKNHLIHFHPKKPLLYPLQHFMRFCEFDHLDNPKPIKYVNSDLLFLVSDDTLANDASPQEDSTFAPSSKNFSTPDRSKYYSSVPF